MNTTRPKRPDIEKLTLLLGAITASIAAVTALLDAMPGFLAGLSQHPFAAISIALLAGIAGLIYFWFGAPRVTTKARRGIAAVIFIALGGLCLVLLAGLLRLRERPFYDGFDARDKDRSLSEAGWHRLNPDDALWNKPDTDGCLTLYTAPGDNWTKSGEKCSIRNLIVRANSWRRYDVTVKITNFAPNHNWQQGGILVMRDDDNFVRWTVAYAAAAVREPVVKLQAVAERNGEIVAEFNGDPIGLRWDAQTPLWLRIERDGDEFQFSHKAREWHSFHPDTSIRFNLRHRWLGIAAFEGCTEHFADGTNHPITADPIPVDFERFELQPIQ